VGPKKVPQLAEGRPAGRRDRRNRFTAAHDGEGFAAVLYRVEHVDEVLGRVGSSDLGHQPILGSRVAHQLLAALPDSERAFWATALFCGLRRGELRGLQWLHVDFEDDVIRVERSWDPVKGPVDVKTGAGHRAVPMAFVVRRELRDHQHRTGRGGEDLVFGRTATEAFFASTIRCRANRAWQAAGLQPLTPHEARHCAISYFIAAGSAPESSALEEESANHYRATVRLQTQRGRGLWHRLWRTTQKARNPRQYRGFRSTATGIRTRVSAVRGRRPSPLDDSGEGYFGVRAAS
jgi:integrase